MRRLITAAIWLSTAIGTAGAAEIKCLFPLAFRSSLAELVPQFQKSTGDTVSIDYGTIGALTARIKKDDYADVVMVSDSQFSDLQREGKVVPGSGVDVAKLGIGAFVHKGALKPEIDSVDSFTHALLSAKSIAYVDPAAGAPSGIYMARLMERLGIADKMTPKTKLTVGGGTSLFDAVAKGDAEIGFIQMTELLAEPRVELVGPLPSDLQDYTKYVIGLVAKGKQQQAGKTLIKLITSPSALATMKYRGLEPPD